MNKQRNYSGFAIVEGGLILVLVTIVAFAGYKIYQDRNNANKLNEQSASQQVAVPKATTPTGATTVPTAIKSTADLDKAASALNSDNPDDNSADLTQIDTQASTF